MKITPAKDYKKPLYAIGVTAAIMAVSVTGCTDFASGFKGGTKETEQVDLAGAADILTDETTYCKRDADDEPVLAGEVELDGDVAITEPYETAPEPPILDGGAPIEEN
ncbi:MAG: hypothetical protein IKG01_13120 [Lachnospiraceae bacterium]|nr:hypothetical protein [Lachnospiraceae bacterium]